MIFEGGQTSVVTKKINFLNNLSGTKFYNVMDEILPIFK